MSTSGAVRSFFLKHGLLRTTLPGLDLFQVTTSVWCHRMMILRPSCTSMVSRSKIIKVEASNKETQEKVLVGEAKVEQTVSAYIFTG